MIIVSSPPKKQKKPGAPHSSCDEPAMSTPGLNNPQGMSTERPPTSKESELFSDGLSMFFFKKLTIVFSDMFQVKRGTETVSAHSVSFG
jgi:hypothetical protein